MAFNLKNLVRVVDRSRHIVQPSVSFSLFRRSVHANVYDKNPEDLVQHNVVISDEAMETSDEYWAPHPKTGIFGPPAYSKLNISDSVPTNIGDDSVLELKVWFRSTSLEDVEKPM